MFQRREPNAPPGRDDLWERLSGTWHACVELAWEAYRAGSLPIGSVVADASGNVLARGRHRIHERSGEDGHLFGGKLAHAEVNALVTLDNDGCDPAECTLYTTTEPCPLCVGAVRMADVGRGALRREGALGRVRADVRGRALPQARQRHGCRTRGWCSGEHPCRVAHRVLPAPKTEDSRVFLDAYEVVMPEAVVAGTSLYRSGALGEIGSGHTPVMLSVVSRALRNGA